MKKLFISIALILLILIIGLSLFFIYKPKTEITPASSTNLNGRTLKELSLLNKPIQCKVIGLLEKIRAERKEGEGTTVPIKIDILGTKMRVEGIGIWTDGKEQPNLNIYSGTKVYSLLLDGSNRMAQLDTAVVGGISKFSETVPVENLNCKSATLDDSLFFPTNICYSDKEPTCY